MTTLLTTSSKVNVRRLQAIIELRILVGFLGEQSQHNWWPSGFFSSSASAFLSPVFNKTTMLAQYQGVKEAACRVHDERIGVGQRVFHLFRLPVSMEQALFNLLRDVPIAENITQDIASTEAANKALLAVSKSPAELREGPLQIGFVSDLDKARWLKVAAAAYAGAFEANSRSFPYLAGDT